MSITPSELREVEFRPATFRGYHPDDVDQFLERLAAGLEVLQQRLREATERAVRAERSAQRTHQVESDKAMRRLLADSQAEADAMLSLARSVAARNVAGANAYAHALGRETQQILQRTASRATSEVEADLRRLESERARIRAELLAFERIAVSDALPQQGRPRWPQCLLGGEPPVTAVTS